MKVAVNKCFGGFGLSKQAIMEIAKRKGIRVIWKGSYNHRLKEYVIVEDWESPEARYCYAYTENGDSFSFREPDKRNDPDLIAVIERLGEKADGDYADIVIVEIPDDIAWYIDNYDGRETVREHHNSW